MPNPLKPQPSKPKSLCYLQLMAHCSRGYALRAKRHSETTFSLRLLSAVQSSFHQSKGWKPDSTSLPKWAGREE